MTHDPFDDARALLEVTALLKENIQDLIDITDETAMLRAENAQLR